LQGMVAYATMTMLRIVSENGSLEPSWSQRRPSLVSLKRERSEPINSITFITSNTFITDNILLALYF
jgi:hypothetical protein